MSRLSELAETMRSESEQQAESTRQMLHSVMQQHRQAIESDLNELRSAISSSIRATGEMTERNLKEHLTARPKRIARLWWFIAVVGLLAAMILWSLTLWLGVGALTQTRATVMDCPTDDTHTETVECVLVKRGKIWKADKVDEVYMEIKQ